MIKHECYDTHQEVFEYHGNTEIERIRKQGENVIQRDWIIFDTVEAAIDYFSDNCSEQVEFYPS